MGGKLSGSLSAVAAGPDVYVFGLDAGGGGPRSVCVLENDDERLHRPWVANARQYPGGGYLLLFCEVGKKRIVREKLEKLGGQFTDFAFVEEGLQIWRSTCL